MPKKRHSGKIDGPASVEEAHAYAMSQGALCTACPLYGQQRGPVRPRISSHSRLVIVGESPDGQDIANNEVFTGPTGAQLHRICEKNGLDRSQVSETYATLCSPPGNRGNMKIFLQKEKAKYSKLCRDERKTAKMRGRKADLPPRPLTPQQACLPRLQSELVSAGGDVLLALGTYGLKAVGAAYQIPVGNSKKEVRGQVRISSIDKQSGHPVELPECAESLLPARTLLSSMHPNMAKADPSAGDMISDHIALAVRITDKGGYEWPDALEVVVPSVTVIGDDDDDEEQVAEYEEPSQFLAKMRTFVAAWQDKGCPNPTVDIETEGIEWVSRVRCIGFGYGERWKEHIIVVPLRFKSGKGYWPREYRDEVKELLRVMMNSARLGGQNFAFDSRHLIRLGLMDDHPVNRTLWFDTMIAYKNTREGNLRRGLDAITTRYLREDGPGGTPIAIRLWKGDVDHKASDNIQRDWDLWWYCHEDVKNQHRIRDPAFEWIKEDKTGPQFRTDLQLQPVLRNMGELGILIDEKTRLENKAFIENRLETLKGELQQTVGIDDFNPNSSMQVAEWLYETQGYDPVINPQGKPWEEGDSMSTSIPALMQMEDMYPEDTDPLLHRFTSAQIQYKALNKLLNGFVDSQDKHAFHPLFPQYRWAHPVFKTTILSGRYASNPNFQNWPKRSVINMRQMIHAAPGHVLVAADLDQAELRALIVAAGSERLEDAVHRGLDPHALNAASLMAKTQDELSATYDRLVAWKNGEGTADQKIIADNARMVAKIFFFAAAYGAWVETLFKHMKTFRDKATGKRVFTNYTPTENRRNYDLFHSWNPTFKKWHQYKNDQAHVDGWIVDLWGHRKIPFCHGVAKDNEPPNQEIQTTIATQMNRAILAVADLIPFRSWSPYTGILLQVHDELVVQVPESKVDKAIKILEGEMPSVLGGRIPIGCEAGASRVLTGKAYVPTDG